jgi:hypothetical protein
MVMLLRKKPYGFEKFDDRTNKATNNTAQELGLTVIIID